MSKRKLLKLDTACKGVEWLFKLANYRLAVDIQAISLSAEKMFSSAGEVSIQDVLHHGVILGTCCCS